MKEGPYLHGAWGHGAMYWWRKVLYLKDHGAMERCPSGGRSFTLKTMGPWSDVLVEEGPLS